MQGAAARPLKDAACRRPLASVPPRNYPPAFCATSPRPSRRCRRRSAGAATASMRRQEPSTSCGSCFRQSSDCCCRPATISDDVLFGAARALLLAGHDCVLLVNGDSPTLPARLLAQAIEALREPGDRMVLGPASDGGYYLIGLKHPHRQLFTRIAWGTETVARTHMRARRRNRACHDAASGMVRCRRHRNVALAAGRIGRPCDPLSWRRLCRGEPSLPQRRTADKPLRANARGWRKSIRSTGALRQQRASASSVGRHRCCPGRSDPGDTLCLRGWRRQCLHRSDHPRRSADDCGDSPCRARTTRARAMAHLRTWRSC